jgi:hypothetical protein
MVLLTHMLVDEEMVYLGIVVDVLESLKGKAEICQSALTKVDTKLRRVD